jgi:hypothetical protein
MKENALFPIIGAVICAVVAIAFLRSGVASIGDRTGSNGLRISRTKNPFLFWGLVAAVIAFGTYLAVVEFSN